MKDQIILLYSYLHGIWQYRWSALLIAWIVALSGWLVVYALPNQYTASASMHIDTKSIMKPLLKGLTVESDVNEGLGMMSRLLLSRKNLEEIARQTDMDLSVTTPEDMDGLVKKLAASIKLSGGYQNKRKKGDLIYELSYQGTSPELVYQVVSKLLNTLIETTLSSAQTDTAEAQQFLDRQIEEHEKRLSEAEQKLADFKRENVGYMPDKSGGYYNRLQKKQSEIESIRSKIRLAQARLQEMNKQLKGEKPILDSSASRMTKLRHYQEQLQNLLTQFTEQHPDVVALRNNIADLLASDQADEKVDAPDPESGVPVEFNPVYQNLKADVHRASVEVETLKLTLAEKENSLKVLEQSADIIPEVEAQLAKLNRDYEITRERYLSMVERRESARLAQEVGLSGSNIKFQIIEPPRVPTKPSGPDRLIMLIAVFFIAIAAGLGWGFLRYMINPTFIDTSQLRDNIGLPVLGSVGLYLTTAHKRKRRLQLTSFLLSFSLLIGAFGLAVMFMGVGSDIVSALAASKGIVL